MSPSDTTRADVLYTADLHGSRELYVESFALARRLGVRAVILGGDLAPHATVDTGNPALIQFCSTWICAAVGRGPLGGIVPLVITVTACCACVCTSM